MRNAKVCKKCGLEKPLTDFSKNRKTERTECKPCFASMVRNNRNKKPPSKNATRRAQWKHYYGIHMDQDTINLNLEKQNWACAICKDDLHEVRYHQDHDHSTNAIRGVLCSKCNMALGLFDDDPHLLKLAANYLEKYRNEERI